MSVEMAETKLIQFAIIVMGLVLNQIDRGYMSSENLELIKNEAAADNNGIEERLLADTGFFKNEGQQQNMLNDCGVIDSLSLPESWLKQNRDKTSMEPFHIDFKNGDALLSFREKGHRVSEQAGLRFTKALGNPPAKQNAERLIDVTTDDGKKEFEGLNPVIADDLDQRNFKVKTVKVRELNGVNVLEVTGTKGRTTAKGEWVSSGRELSCIYIDKFGKGDAVQEIRLDGNAEVFPKLKTDLDNSLKSLKWKPAGNP